MSAPIVEFVSLAELAKAAPAWRELCARAAEPNPFAEPDFLLPLLTYEQPRRLAFALVRAADGRLIGFAAFARPPLGVGLLRVWQSAYAALPAFAFDREAAALALGALFRFIGPRTRFTGIVWPLVEPGGPFAAALRSLAEAERLPLIVATRTRRAALRLNGAAAFEAGLNPRRRTKWARQLRRLAAQGEVDATSGLAAIEAYFAVERRGWKGERRTALADDPRRLGFARAALDAFARSGRLDVLTLRLKGEPIAAGLVLLAGARAFYWKTAYDEAYSEASPGVQLTLAHSRRLAQTTRLALVDSCAVEDHPMIGRVWSDALDFETLALGLRPESGRPLAIWLALTHAKAVARKAVKSWVSRALGRKHS